ncbi:hypothetical protein IW262DRAFT_1296901 [Armillaria fumosa]|nr:hypothetical protein IW262DRAFT_1296901 [Armillaria fumosa]
MQRVKIKIWMQPLNLKDVAEMTHPNRDVTLTGLRKPASRADLMRRNAKKTGSARPFPSQLHQLGSFSRSGGNTTFALTGHTSGVHSSTTESKFSVSFSQLMGGISGGMSTFIVDITFQCQSFDAYLSQIRRCCVLWGRRWLMVLIAGLCAIVGTIAIKEGQ